MTDPNTPPPASPSGAGVWAAVLGLALVLAAYVTLELSGEGAGALLLANALPLLGILGVAQATRRQSAALAERVDVVRRQTNGVMDARIHEGATRAVRQVLREAGFESVPSPHEPVPDAPATPYTPSKP